MFPLTFTFSVWGPSFPYRLAFATIASTGVCSRTFVGIFTQNAQKQNETFRPYSSPITAIPYDTNNWKHDLLLHNSWSLLELVFFQDAQLRDGETGSIFVQQVLHILFSKGIFWQSKAIISTTCAIRSDKCCLVMLVSCEKDEKWRKERSLVIK